ncbi:MAG: hypothetical protein AB7E95_03535 [Kiritimatiellales bacterium]
MKTAAIVILYYPPESVIENILSYSRDVQFLVVVDNSLECNDYIPNRLRCVVNTEYFHMPENIGMAASLNIGAEVALQHGCTHLLTMDQDSRFMDGDFLIYLQRSRSLFVTSVAMTVPLHLYRKVRKKDDGRSREISLAMTSGSILNLNAYKDCGRFDESFFIDHVDHEYCLRLRSRGWKLWEVREVLLRHCLGNVNKARIFFFFQKEYISHSPERGYYNLRNGLQVLKKYKGVRGVEHVRFSLLADILKSVFFEAEKRKRIYFFLKAAVDFRQEKFGKLSTLTLRVD